MPRGDCSTRNTLLRELREEPGLDTLVLLGDVTLAELSAPLAKVRLSPTYGLHRRTLFQTFAWISNESCS